MAERATYQRGSTSLPRCCQPAAPVRLVQCSALQGGENTTLKNTNTMKLNKSTIEKIINILITILTAVATTLGLESCL